MGSFEALNSPINSPVSDFISEAIPLVPTTCNLRPLFAKARPASPLQKRSEARNSLILQTHLTNMCKIMQGGSPTTKYNKQ